VSPIPDDSFLERIITFLSPLAAVLVLDRNGSETRHFVRRFTPGSVRRIHASERCAGIAGDSFPHQYARIFPRLSGQ
jgi:hypothetical protein